MDPTSREEAGQDQGHAHAHEEARARHWTSKVHEYQGKLAALAAAEARGAPNEAELA